MTDAIWNQGYTQNRELSWLEFNARVLAEAEDETVPLLERFKFLAIFTSNLDEFFMIRVGSLTDMAALEPNRRDTKSGLTARRTAQPHLCGGRARCTRGATQRSAMLTPASRRRICAAPPWTSSTTASGNISNSISTP